MGNQFLFANPLNGNSEIYLLIKIEQDMQRHRFWVVNSRIGKGCVWEAENS